MYWPADVSVIGVAVNSAWASVKPELVAEVERVKVPELMPLVVAFLAEAIS